MKDFLKVNEFGMIEEVRLDGQEIPFRSGEWIGPAWQVTYGGETHAERKDARLDGEDWRLNFWAIRLKRRISVQDGELVCNLSAENAGSQPFYPDKLSVWLGVDTYMATYPEWNEKLFPTMLRCEKTHFYGYFASPSGKILAVCAPQAIGSWRLQYNHMFSDKGHRIEGVALDLLCAGELADHHPSHACIAPGEKLEWELRFKYVPSVKEALRWASVKTGAPVVSGERLIFERGEAAEVSFFAPETIEVSCGSVRKKAEDEYAVLLAEGAEGGTTVLQACCGGKQAEARIYRRRKWSWYLKRAAEEALRSPQKASSHVESWYGYFSGLLAMRHLPDDQRDQAILDSMNANIPLAYDMQTGLPTVIPNRIQNTAGLVSIAADAWQATGDEKWLRLAENAADFLIDHCQDVGGVFRNGSGVHYTCVLYIAKSIQELWLCERELPGHEERAKKYFEAVRRAVDELVEHLDDIGTEGETTFEDGMISCSMTQIGFFALYLPEQERGRYIHAAETLLRKHRCLERMGSPDCRCRNTTLRFWEAQYDVLIPTNMISSPHGWSAWKAYGVWYLYLLTKKEEYLTDVMELLGCCAQLIGEDGKMSWSFIVDPQIRSFVMEPDKEGRISPKPAVFGECYLPMISSWYRAPEDKPVFGYLGEYRGFSTDQGGCCDNDVHEWVKAMGEIVLPYAYIHEGVEGFVQWNLQMKPGEAMELVPADETVQAVHVCFEAPRRVIVRFEDASVQTEIKEGWIGKKGVLTGEIPC